MKINKNKLLKTLEQVKSGLASKEIVEQSTSFFFQNDRVMAYNDRISVSAPIEDVGIYGAVDAKDLMTFLNKIKKEEIELHIKDNQLKIKAEGKAGLTIQDIKMTFENDPMEVTEWFPLPDMFIPALRFTKNTCSQDYSRPKLLCINVREDGIIESSDGPRISQYDVGPMKGDFGNFLILKMVVDHLVKYDVKYFSITDTWLYFKNDDGLFFSCRAQEEKNYINTSFVHDEGGIEIKLPKKLAEVVERVSVFSSEDLGIEEMITVNIQDKKMKLSAINQNGSWSNEELPIRYDKEPIEFCIHAKFFIEMLDKISTVEMTQRSLAFKTENWLYMVALSLK